MSRRAGPALLAAAVAALLVAAFPALGHTADKSFSIWRFDGNQARVTCRIRLAELAKLPPGAIPEEYLPAHLLLRTDAGVAGAAGPAVWLDSSANEWAFFRWTLDLGGAAPRAIESTLFADAPVAHLHFARIDDPSGGGEVRQRVLSVRDATWALGEGEGATLLGYVMLGVHHILEGYDHLAFVLALLLLAGSLREVAGLVTAFTLAHSITLALATVGAVRPQGAAVEIMIGFSIALVAAENCWQAGGRPRTIPVAVVAALLAGAGLAAAGLVVLAVPAWLGLALFSGCHFSLLGASSRPARLRAVLAFGFGLVHGFGFAGVLMEVGLPSDGLVSALLGFNVGVELGQLLVVTLLYPVLRLLERRLGEGRRTLVAEVGSAAVFALGLYWVVVRNVS